MTEEKNRINHIKEILIISILFLYVFKGFAVKLNIDKLSYVLSIFLMLISLLTIKNIKISRILMSYLLIGIISIFTTYFLTDNNSIKLAIIGFISSYFNLILWYTVFSSYNNNEKKILFNKYIKVIITFAVISSLLGVYQTLVDSTINGMAINELYSNEELLSSGKIVRRATALLGSAQNYGLFVGIGFCAVLFSEKLKANKKIILLIILLIGILASGSRSASISVLIALLIKLFYLIKNGKIKKIYILILMLSSISLILIGSLVRAFDEATIKRLVDFDVTPALTVYSKSINKIDFTNVILGRGLGYRDWTVNQLIGNDNYYLAFGENYTSAESVFMLIFLQSGLIRSILYIGIMLYAIIRMYLHDGKMVFSIIVCLIVNQIFTPSFSGMAMSYAFWLLIIYAILGKEKTEVEKIENEY